MNVFQKYYQTCVLKKPEPRKRVKGRKDRAEAKRKIEVRADVEARDGYCRIANDVVWPVDGPNLGCRGRSEWAHFGEKKRARTRNQAPELRHTTAGSFKACMFHHDLYDRGKLAIIATTGDGCDGPLTYELRS